MNDRIRHPAFAARRTSADSAAAHIRPGDTVAMSGFTGAGYPKAVPQALAARMEEAHAAGERFRVKVLTGASTAPELDGALAKVDGMELRMPYQSDPEVRARINAGQLDYIDIHLSHVAQHAWFGFFGEIDVALVEVAGINADGTLVPSSSVGIPNIAGSGPGWAANSVVIGPLWLTTAMKCAIAAPQPLRW